MCDHPHLPLDKGAEQDAALPTRAGHGEWNLPAGPPIDEDLYCLTCGYNLRGLYGDPVRCPECGDFNDLGLVTIPSELIRRVLDSMETAPTVAVAIAMSATIVLAITLRVPWSSLPVPAGILFVLGCGWYAAMWRVRSVFRRKPGWGRILWSFHLAMAAWVGSVVLLILCIVLIGHTYPLWVSAILYVLSIGVLILVEMFGGRTYRRARAEIARMQRDEAVRIGREELRKAMRSGVSGH